MEDELAIEFTWLPFESELLELKSLLGPNEPKKVPPIYKLQTHLKRLFNLDVSIKDCKHKIAFAKYTPSMFYAEYLFNIACSVQHEQKFSQSDSVSKRNYYKKLIKMFCSRFSDVCSPELYLSIDTSSFIEKHLKTNNSLICMNSFSLGNIVKLNKFVEHFSSEHSLKSYKYKITQVKVRFMHDEKMLYLYFVSGKIINVKKRSTETHRMFCFNIPYSSLHTIVICHTEKISVYFRLNMPPMLYGVNVKEDEDYISFMDLTSRTQFIRSVVLFEDEGQTSKALEIGKEFSMNSVLCLNFKNEDYVEVVKIRKYNKGIHLYFANMNCSPYKPANLSIQISDFECYYAYKCLLTHSYELLDQLIVKEELDEFRNIMVKNSQPGTKTCKVLSEALYKIYSAISKCNIVILNYSLKRMLDAMAQSGAGGIDDIFNDKKSILMVRRAIIIPTHVRFLPPHPILKSRALRKCNSDYSLRVSIRDVNLETINFSFKGFSEERKFLLKNFFADYFRPPMIKGINVNKNRHYKYVGGSTSQLRGHGVWFYAKDENGKTADMLRKEFGEFDKIKQVPKYMARLGQTFSQALGNIKVPQADTNVNHPEDDIKGGIKIYMSEDDVDNINKKYLKVVETIEDINSDAEPYNFSDGIGRISSEIAEEVYKVLKLDDKPAAMQIRYAGCKGMLVVDPNLKGRQIFFRESMKKFSSTDDSLEILKLSEKRVASLNRPLITILEQLGVPKVVFVKLQKDMIQNYIKSMFYEPEAAKFLQRNSKLRLDFWAMHQNGICFTEDPLFRSIIYALFQKEVDLLKSKANIELPADKGRAMFGVLDETKTLKYGQVFIQYTSFEDETERIVHTGTVVVTKNPCMHPGDVRKFEAIDVEELHHICDCIVFPTKGPRPHPDEMAGSDLDGDEYHVMWYEDFIFSSENSEAMHYAMPKDNSNDREIIRVEDELEHLCNYIIHDNVGLIASAHLAFADKDKEGIFGERCLRLAKKYAVALDFAKSGKVASRDKRDKCFTYPDFMQKFGVCDTYISEKALGILFRNCKRLEVGLETVNSQTIYNLDPDFVYEGWNTFEEPARKMYEYYCRKIDYLIKLFNFSNEGELLAGALINPPKYCDQRHDLDNLMTLLEHGMRTLFKDLETNFFKEFDGKPADKQFTVEMYQKASAWYIIAYDKDKNTSAYNYFGLPWAVSDVLLDIKQEKGRLGMNRGSNFKSLIEDIMDKFLIEKYSMPDSSESTEIDVIFQNRLEVLDVAEQVLKKWVNIQEEHVFIRDIKQFRKITLDEFKNIAELLLTCKVNYIKQLKETGNLKKAVSSSYYVLETLLKLACKRDPEQNTSLFDSQQELSLISWVTLIKLACTYNPDYLGIGDSSSTINLLPHDSETSTFRQHLFVSAEYSEQFSKDLIHEPQKVIEYLKDVSKVKDLDFRFDIDKDKRYVSIFTVEGSRYAIEKLKDIVVQRDFFMWVVKEVKLFAIQ